MLQTNQVTSAQSKQNYWLKVNGGFIGPFISLKDAQIEYRSIFSNNVYSASVWTGLSNPSKLYYPII